MKRNKHRKTNCLNVQNLFIAALALIFINPGMAKSTQIPSGANKILPTTNAMNSNHLPELTKDGTDFLKRMADAANALQSYSFNSHMTVYKGSKTINESSLFYFKKPRKIRAEELGPFKKGSVAILLPNGKVKGHMGGLMSKFVSTVDAGSDWVTSANGYLLGDSDFYGMSQVMLNFARAGKKTFVSETPLTVNGQPRPVFVLEMYTSPSRSEIMKRAYIVPETLLPVEWFDYKNGKLFAHTIWKDLQTGVEISDALFVL